MLGESPLYLAVSNGRHESVEWLLRNGADVSGECDGEQTPIFAALSGRSARQGAFRNPAASSAS